MFLAPLARMRDLAQVAAICCLLGTPLTYIFQIKSDEDNGARSIRENRRPLVRHALVTADLNEERKAPAMVDGELEPVIISAPPTAPRNLKNRMVLVFFSTTMGCWRFISDNPEQLDTSTMDYIEAHPAGVDLKVVRASLPSG